MHVLLFLDTEYHSDTGLQICSRRLMSLMIDDPAHSEKKKLD